MARKSLDQISYNGELYGFVDQDARDSVTALSSTVNTYNEKVTGDLMEEISRAKNAEQALELTKVSVIEGKSLSTYDFNDHYKGRIDNPPIMTGATAYVAGEIGVVPAPSVGDHTKYLDGSGHWSVPHDTTYDPATQISDGLMSAYDKRKVDNILADDTFVSGVTTFNEDGSITYRCDIAGGTREIRTVFSADGSITQYYSLEDGYQFVVYTTFVEGAIEKRVVQIAEEEG